MKVSARLYLIFGVGGYSTSMGSAIFLAPERFNSVSFDVIAHQMPCGMQGWAWVHIVVGLIAFFAAWRGRERPAWAALIAAASMIGAWTYGFYVAFTTQPTAAVSGLLAYATLTIIHVIQAREPLRSPFEPLLEAIPDDK